MKAGIFEGIGRLTVREVPDPQMEPGTVLLRVKACSICGSDLRNFRHGHPRINPPQIMGHEIAAEIAAISETVSGYHEEDRVTVTPRIACGKCRYCRKKQYTYCKNGLTFGYQLPGGYAEYMLIPAEGVNFGVLNRYDGNLDYREASLTEPLACCLRAQRISRVSEGETVAVIGGGPMGLIHCRLAAAKGAGRIILVEKRHERLRNISLSGIDHLIDDTDMEREIAELTEGYRADVVIVACSSIEAQQSAISLAGLGGRVNFFGGLPPGEGELLVDSNVMHYKEVELQGSHGSTPEDNRKALEMLLQRALNLDGLVSNTFPLDDIEKAFLFAESREGMHAAILP